MSHITRAIKICPRQLFAPAAGITIVLLTALLTALVTALFISPLTASLATAQSPEEYLYNFLKVSKLEQGRQISPVGLKGFSGILPGEGEQPYQRIAVIYYKLNAFVFTGQVDK